MTKSKLAVKKLKTSLEEERRRYQDILVSFREMRNRTLVFLSVELAIMTYFFANLNEILPNELYGIIFFTIGVICIAVSIALLFYRYRMIPDWPDPVGPVELIKINQAASESEYLRIIVNDYKAASAKTNEILHRHAVSINWSLYLFVIGAIILLIIKFF